MGWNPLKINGTGITVDPEFDSDGDIDVSFEVPDHRGGWEEKSEYMSIESAKQLIEHLQSAINRFEEVL